MTSPAREGRDTADVKAIRARLYEGVPHSRLSFSAADVRIVLDALARSEAARQAAVAAHTAAYDFIDRLRDEHIIDFGEKLTDDLRGELLALLAASDAALDSGYQEGGA